ncbi:MAG: sugar O-acyltransferase (sialic acid O-acetyltransferase NeuD family) [Psychroserpens sp.]|jgi:sugar O-acyltransferase (sialic acid O-acetyltransferase NeuD family)
MKKNILIMGSSGYAKVIIDIIEKQRKYSISGLIDTFVDIGEETFGYKVLGSEDDIPELILSKKIFGLILAIGDNYIREEIYKKIKKIAPTLEFITAIHPSAIIGKDVVIGNGSAIMGGVIINPSCEISSHCIINTNASVDHDSKIGEFSSLAPNSCTGGNVVLNEGVVIGIGATILHGIKIGKYSVIGASALVNNDVTEFSVVYGVPAKKIRSRNKSDQYL